MFGSSILYSGLLISLTGVIFGVLRKKHGLAIFFVGVVLAAIALLLPARERRIARPVTQLDRFAPVWQFSERHSIEIDAPPQRVYDALRAVTPNEILFFRALTSIRRGGRPLPESILNAPENEPILDVATRSGFVWLADDPPGEVAVGTVVAAPPGTTGTLTAEVFRQTLKPGFALASMNFVVRDNGRGGSHLFTETRVYANSAEARQKFAVYWRVIYPGSAIIRRMWLRAVKKRAEEMPRGDSKRQLVS